MDKRPVLIIMAAGMGSRYGGLKQMDLIRCRKEGKQVIYCLADDHVHTILQMGMDHVKE